MCFTDRVDRAGPLKALVGGVDAPERAVLRLLCFQGDVDIPDRAVIAFTTKIPDMDASIAT